MWKYVTRRIRDSVEKTYNVLDVRLNWPYGGEAANNVSRSSAGQSTNQNPSRNNCTILNRQSPNCSSKSSSSHERKHENWSFPRTFFDVVVVANAVFFTWYGRRECLQRRKLRSDDWKTRSHCRFRQSPNAHKSVATPLVLTAPGTNGQSDASNGPNASNDQYITNAPVCVEPIDSFQSNNFFKLYTVHPINNEHGAKGYPTYSTNAHSIPVQVIESPIDIILKQLVALHASLEFNLGLENLVAKRPSDAVSHFKAATAHHHLEAGYNLGLCYEQGIGIEKDMKMALECYIQVANRGHAKAIYNLGVFHAQGLGGLEKNKKTARECFVSAATLGLSEAKKLFPHDNFPNEQTKKSDETLDARFKSNPSPIISNIFKHESLRNFLLGDNRSAMDKKKDTAGLRRKKIPSDSMDEGYKSDMSPTIFSKINDELFLSLIEAKKN